MDDIRLEARVLVFAPIGRDAKLITAVLAQERLLGEVCPTEEALKQKFLEGAGAAIMTTEVLSKEMIDQLVTVLEHQPPWSAIPIVVLTGGGATTRTSMRQLSQLERLKSITLLERPVRKVTLISAVRVALRLRRRQYDIRDFLEERKRAEEERDRLLTTLQQEGKKLQ